MAKPQLRKSEKRVSPVKTIKVGTIDYEDTVTLRKSISDHSEIRARRVAGVSIREQRKIAKAVKNAREMVLLPYSSSARWSEAHVMTTKLILTYDVSHLGSTGEIMEVKDGYIHNYLLPRKLATPWTKGAQRQIDQMAEAHRRHFIKSLKHAQTVYAWLQENIVTVSATAGDNGHLFDTITIAAYFLHTLPSPRDWRSFER